MIALIAYILTILAANWALQTIGFVPVAPHLLAPAGVYFAGLAYVLRNAVQETLGRRWRGRRRAQMAAKPRHSRSMAHAPVRTVSARRAPHNARERARGG